VFKDVLVIEPIVGRIGLKSLDGPKVIMPSAKLPLSDGLMIILEEPELLVFSESFESSVEFES
jgi:hypothetical protein